MPKVKEFYQKCGFSVAEGITQRFIYRKDNENITNQDGQIIFYQESSDQMIKHILASPEKEILIPTDGL